jgi:hypothetical protein
MCTKWFADGDVHKYFNPYDTPYDSYINFMNVHENLDSRCNERLLEHKNSSIKPVNDLFPTENSLTDKQLQKTYD